MNLREFEYIVAIDEVGSFAMAAKKCFVSQPTLSMQVAKLEAELNVKIFERSGRKIIATASGRDILERAKILLAEVEEIKIIARGKGNIYERDIKLGAFPTLAPYFLPRFFEYIQNEFPKIKLSMFEEKTAELLEKLDYGKLDIAFLAGPINNNKLNSIELFEDDFLLATHVSHRLATRKRIAVSELSDEQLLLLEEGHCFRDQALEVCKDHNTSEDNNFRATSLETLRQMVSSNIGITLIPNIAVRDMKNIRYIKFSRPVPKRIICLVWRRSSTEGELYKKIAEGIKKYMKREGKIF